MIKVRTINESYKTFELMCYSEDIVCELKHTDISKWWCTNINNDVVRHITITATTTVYI